MVESLESSLKYLEVRYEEEYQMEVSVGSQESGNIQWV